jgi:DNA-binding MarR family transcriptional regulator
MDRHRSTAPGHKRAIQALLRGIKPLVDLSCSIPFPYVLTFLTVAVDEGKPVGAYAREMNVNRFLMSRYMRCIGARGRNGGPGLGLVTVKRTRKSSTKTAVFLTAKGREIAAQLHQNLWRSTE